ncbi:DUF4197 domain-containing protein [Wenyingzhuangia sp.]|uniref:DUF4197 domain-containing protein n=1 Tax=Wenyingzhuangia sp. TaxID=1964193 RepID=UPI00321BEA39
MKKTISLFILLGLLSCSALTRVDNKRVVLKNQLSALEVQEGLIAVLQKGLNDQVVPRGQNRNFYDHELDRVGFPLGLQKLDIAMRKYGLSDLADKGLLGLNRTVASSLKAGVPELKIVIDSLVFKDVDQILHGGNHAVTAYFFDKKKEELNTLFKPIVKKYFETTGADEVWRLMIEKYNQIPFVQKINPDLIEEITKQTLDCLYDLISLEELSIRTEITSRNSNLLKRVFSLQEQ